MFVSSCMTDQALLFFLLLLIFFFVDCWEREHKYKISHNDGT